MKDLQPSQWVNSGVINCFALILNHEENQRIAGVNVFYGEDKVKGSKPCLFCHTDCFTENTLKNESYGDLQRVEKLRSSLFLGVDKKPSLMSLSTYCVICFPILEYGHFYLVCFDLVRPAITAIDNMSAIESPVQLINDENFFKKGTPYKVKDIFTKYLKLVNHTKARQVENAVPEIIDFPWKSVGNTVDCGVFVMRHMET